jgi:hypothetical protein
MGGAMSLKIDHIPTRPRPLGQRGPSDEIENSQEVGKTGSFRQRESAQLVLDGRPWSQVSCTSMHAPMTTSDPSQIFPSSRLPVPLSSRRP